MDNTIHKSYTAGFKLTVIDRAEKIGNRAAAREFNVDEKCVRRWRTDKEDLQRMPLLKKAQRGGIVAWPDLERELDLWIKNHGAASVLEIQARAKLIAEQMGLTNFKGNINWCYRFMKRKQISVKSKTVIQRDWNENKSSLKSVGSDFKLTVVSRAEKVGDKTAAQEFDVCESCIQKWRSGKEALEKNTARQNSQIDFDKEISSFLESISLTAEKEKLTYVQIANVDEIPFSFHFVSNIKGNMSIPVLTAGNEKLSFTCVISCAANGDRLKPLVVFKRKILPQVNYPADIVIRTSERGGMCENIVYDWLYEVWRKRKGAILDPRGMLIIDSTQKQLFESLKSEYEEMSTKLAVIPKGLKKYLHPLSFLINKTFENEMMKCYERWISSASHSFTKGGKMRKAAPEEIVKWVLESWKSVKVSTIVYGFTQAGIISPKFDVKSETSAVFEEAGNSCQNKYEELKEDINMYENDSKGIRENLNAHENNCEETEKEDLSMHVSDFEKSKECMVNSSENIVKKGINSYNQIIEGGIDRKNCVHNSGYEKIKTEDAKNSDNVEENIGVNEFLHNECGINGQKCEKIKTEEHSEGTIGVDEFLHSLFASDSDESE